jgi:hypothetical protein
MLPVSPPVLLRRKLPAFPPVHLLRMMCRMMMLPLCSTLQCLIVP